MRAATIPAVIAATLIAGLPGLAGAGPRGSVHQEAGGPRARADAERYADRAKAHYDAREYAAAAAAYREAYRRYPSAGLLYNLGQAYRLLGDCDTATTMYLHYLQLAPRSRYRRIVLDHLAGLEACDQPPAAVGAASDGQAAAPRLAGPWPVLDHPLDEVELDPGAEPPRGDAGRARKIAGVALGSAGVVLAGFGVYFAVDAGRAADEVSALYARGATWAEVESIDARGRRSEVLGGAMLGVGAAAIAAGATLYVLGGRAERRAASLAVTPSGDGVDVQVSWRF